MPTHLYGMLIVPSFNQNLHVVPAVSFEGEIHDVNEVNRRGQMTWWLRVAFDGHMVCPALVKSNRVKIYLDGVNLPGQEWGSKNLPRRGNFLLTR